MITTILVVGGLVLVAYAAYHTWKAGEPTTPATVLKEVEVNLSQLETNATNAVKKAIASQETATADAKASQLATNAALSQATANAAQTKADAAASKAN